MSLEEFPKHNIFLLYGPPGSGKTSLGISLSEKLQVEYLSTGTITRAEIAKKTCVGKKLKKYLDLFTEYPPDLIATLIWQHVTKPPFRENGILLDGFPRYLEETNIFLKMLDGSSFELRSLVALILPIEQAIRRVGFRRICPTCLEQFDIYPKNEGVCISCGDCLVRREDDNIDILRQRYRDYEECTATSFDLLKNRCGSSIIIDGSKAREEILIVAVNGLKSFLRPSSSAERAFA